MTAPDDSAPSADAAAPLPPPLPTLPPRAEEGSPDLPRIPRAIPRPAPGRRAQVASATVSTLVSFLVRRIGEAAVLVIIGLHVARSDFGNFTAWKAIFPPLLVALAGGWDTALLRRRHNAPARLMALIYWSVAATILLSIGLVAGGGLIARWYRLPEMALWFRLGALVLMIHVGARAVRSLLTHQLDLATVARWEIIRMGIWGIGMTAVALGPGGPFAPEPGRVERFILVHLLADLTEALGLLFVSRGGHELRAAVGRARRSPVAFLKWRAIWRSDWRFCAVITLDSLVNAIAVGLPVYLIGRRLGGDAITLFAYGYQLVATPLYVLLDSVNRALLPGLSRIPRADLAARAREVVRVLSLGSMPVLLWTFAVAPHFFVTLFGPDWYDAGLLTRCFILYLLLAPMTNISGAIEAIVNRAGIGLAWNLTTLAGRAAVLWWGLEWAGLLGGMLAFGVFSLLMWGFYQYLIARMLGVSVREWIANYLRFVPVWGFMLVFWVLWPEAQGRGPGLAWMGAGGAAGVAIYAGLLAVFHRAEFREMLALRHLWRRR